jgi:hypothetical protein
MTNLESIPDAIKAFKLQSGIEAMFKDCKTGGYNLESTSADGHCYRLYLCYFSWPLLPTDGTTKICCSSPVVTLSIPMI